MDIMLILQTNYVGQEWSIADNDYSTLEWFSDSKKPTEAELEAQWPDVEYQVAYNDVSASRHAAYIAPGGSDAVFMKYQRGEATEQEWLDAVTAINDANPYPVKEGK